MQSIYEGSFEDRNSVFSSFGQEDQGENIIYASYELGNYEGQAFVLYEKDGRYYEVHGSHCSCYGLEDQWEPEEVPLEALKFRARNGDDRAVMALNATGIEY
jgi:hypothetical protein